MAFIIVAALLAHGGRAETHEQPGDQLFDPETFDYVNGDYSIIDWGTVDWSKIPATRIQDVPVDRLDYTKLKADQRMEMTTEQIAANLNNINDLKTDVNAERVKEAIKNKYAISGIDLQGSCYIKDDMLQTTGREQYSLPLSGLPSTASIEVKSYGRIILKGVNTPPGKGVFDLYVVGQQEVTLPQGVTVQINGQEYGSRLSFAEGQAFLDEGGRDIIIGNVQIKAGMMEKVFIYFKNPPSSGTFVAIDLENKQLTARANNEEKTGVGIVFLKGNKFIPGDSDELTYLEIKKGSATVSSRAENLVPLVRMESVDGSEIVLSNGNSRYELVDGRLNFATYSGEEIKSTPLVVDMINNGDPVLSLPDGKSGKLIIDDKNNFIVIPSDEPAQESECYTCMTRFFDSSVVAYDAETWKFVKENNIAGLTGEVAPLIRTLRLIRPIPNKLSETIHTVRVLPPEEIRLQCLSERAIACASEYELLVSNDVTPDVLVHELAHGLTYRTENNEATPAEREMKEYELNLAIKYGFQPRDINIYEQDKKLYDLAGQEVTLTEEEQLRLSRLIQEAKKSQKRSFKSAWEEASIGSYDEEYKNAQDIHSFTPKKGCNTIYGCRSFYEDVAEYTQSIIAKQEHNKFKENHLIQPPGHPNHDPARYDPRYKQKIDLLLEYGFITQDDYNKIVEGAT